MKRLFILLACAITMSATALADELPLWLKQAASINVPPQPSEVDAVVLHDESRKTVDEAGRIVTTTWWAVKILNRGGRQQARASEGYFTGSSKVKDMRAWLIRPGGDVKSYGKKDIVDLAQAENDVYNDVREKSISASDDADAGCVFGYEIVTEERGVFSQFVWHFQAINPVMMSRLTVTMPPGWRADGITFNHDKIEPVVTGGSYTWELRDLKPLELEPASPRHLATYLAVNVFPPETNATLLRSFANWKDVSRYTSELSDPQAAFNEAMTAKSRELTAGATSELDRIKAIARYAQNVNYISIQIDVGRGGGYKPHAAADVFGKNYGDCKDKANLMRAMLKSIGIDSYPVVIYSGDPYRVKPEWPSPQQFNHCIIAIKVSDSTEASTIIKHATLGRLLIFDPTDDDTPLGDLPDHEQGSYALISAGDRGDLVRMPVMPVESNRMERTVDAQLNGDGSMTASMREQSFGQAAVDERRAFKRLAKQQYSQIIERWITTTVNGATILKTEPVDSAQSGEFSLSVEFKAPSYAKSMRGNLLVFKPAVIARRSGMALTKPTRVNPIVIESQAYSDTVTVKLPEGFEVDEIPEKVGLDKPFGSFGVSYEVKDDKLIFKRSLVLKRSVVPAEQYSEVRSFFQKMLAVEQAPVVLTKK